MPWKSNSALLTNLQDTVTWKAEIFFYSKNSSPVQLPATVKKRLGILKKKRKFLFVICDSSLFSSGTLTSILSYCKENQISIPVFL